jgi:serine/threonine protein kinase
MQVIHSQAINNIALCYMASSKAMNVDTLVEFIDKNMLSEADPDGKPSHGRAYDVGKLKYLESQLGLVQVIMDSDYLDATKADMLLFLANAVYMAEEGGMDQQLTDVAAFVGSLANDEGILRQYPIWCLPNYIPISNTREAAEKHYLRRQQAMMELGRASEGTAQLYRFIENFEEYFYINKACLCNMITDKTASRMRKEKQFGKGKVGTAYLIKDQEDREYILKTVSIETVGGSLLKKIKSSDFRAPTLVLGTQLVSPNNPVTEPLSFMHDGKEKMLTVGGGDFYTQTIIHMTLNFLLGHSQNYVYQYDAFMCGSPTEPSTGINIMDIASEGDMYTHLNKLLTVDAKGGVITNRMKVTARKAALNACAECFDQLLPLMSYLKQSGIGFMHNDMKVHNIFVNNVGTVAAPDYKYLLADFDKSAISWGNVRFYNNSIGLEKGMEYNGLNPVTLESNLPLTRNTELIGQAVKINTMFNPNGYHLGYDLYTLLFSMLFIPDIYDAYIGLEGTRMHAIVDALINIDPAADSVQSEILKRRSEAGGKSGAAAGISALSSNQAVVAAMLYKYMETGSKTKGTDLNRITTINGILHKSEITIKNNIDEILGVLGLTPFVPDAGSASEEFLGMALNKSVKPIISKAGYVCLENPRNGKCRVPAYRWYARTYTEDDVEAPSPDLSSDMDSWQMIQPAEGKRATRTQPGATPTPTPKASPKRKSVLKRKPKSALKSKPPTPKDEGGGAAAPKKPSKVRMAPTPEVHDFERPPGQWGEMFPLPGEKRYRPPRTMKQGKQHAERAKTDPATLEYMKKNRAARDKVKPEMSKHVDEVLSRREEGAPRRVRMSVAAPTVKEFERQRGQRHEMFHLPQQGERGYRPPTTMKHRRQHEERAKTDPATLAKKRRNMAARDKHKPEMGKHAAKVLARYRQDPK